MVQNVTKSADKAIYWLPAKLKYLFCYKFINFFAGQLSVKLPSEQGACLAILGSGFESPKSQASNNAQKMAINVLLDQT